MFGFGGGTGSKDSDYGGPDEGVGGKGSLAPGVSSGAAAKRDRLSGKSDRVGTGSFGGVNSVGDRDRQGPGNVGNPDVDRGNRMGAETASKGISGIGRAGDIGSASRAATGVGHVGEAIGGSREPSTPSVGSMRAGMGIGDVGEAAMAASAASRAARTASTIGSTAGAGGIGQTAPGAANAAGGGLDAFHESLRRSITGNETEYLGDMDKAYAARGKVQPNGDYAIGRFQIMASNVPSWTKQVLGKSMTPEEFRVDRAAQDAVFDGMFGGMVHNYAQQTGDLKKGVELAAREWYAGPKGMKNLKGHDNASGMSVADYGARVADRQAKEYAGLLSNGVSNATHDATAVASNDFATKYLGGAGSKIGNFSNDYLGPYTQHGFVTADASPPVPSTPAGKRRGMGVEAPKVTQASVTQPATPPAQRPSDTTGGKIAGAGLDIGMGFIPVVGQATGIINAGLALTGNRTLGERVVDLVGEGGQGGTYVPNGDANRPEIMHRETRMADATPTPPAPSFEEKYLGFVDRAKRPTPAEKWGDGSTYASREYA